MCQGNEPRMLLRALAKTDPQSINSKYISTRCQKWDKQSRSGPLLWPVWSDPRSNCHSGILTKHLAVSRRWDLEQILHCHRINAPDPLASDAQWHTWPRPRVSAFCLPPSAFLVSILTWFRGSNVLPYPTIAVVADSFCPEKWSAPPAVGGTTTGG